MSVDLKSPPAELKHLQPYMQRAHEIAQIDPVVSYFCKYYAARLAITLPSPTSETQSYLTELLNQLEEEKAHLAGSESMQSDQAAAQHCTNFGLRVFAKADNEDRAGGAGKATARNFIVSSQFLQVVEAFGPAPEDVKEKIKYAKWRAAEILKAIREGRAPELPPGALNGEESVNPLNAVPSPQPSTMSNISSMASPSPLQQQPPITSPPPQLPMESPMAPTTLPPPAPFSQASSQLDSLPSVPPSTVYTPHPVQPTAMAAVPSPATFIPVPAASLPSMTDSQGELLVDPTDAKSAQKHARWAISALEYDDVETAITNLQKAIQVLLPYRRQ
ncbi:hypothetical protein GGI07_003697 [Coemansia sp. Benny D115]|nr:hypothetical protein GGI07_003697 [Coemansia sp. Benny D115]